MTINESPGDGVVIPWLVTHASHESGALWRAAVKGQPASADARDVTSLTPEVWTAVGLMSIAGVLGFLHVVACVVRNESEMRDLAARISALRAERLARAREVAQSEARVVNIELTGVNAPGTPSADAKPAKK